MNACTRVFTFMAVLPAFAMAAGRPCFYSSFDSEGALASPEDGRPAIVAREVSFCDGVRGKALKVKEGAGSVAFPLPSGLPADRGAIEFYAKIDNQRDWYRDAGDPTFFSVFDEATTNQMVMAFEINANNGIAKSGWYLRMNYLGWVTSLPGFGWHIDYRTCFPDGDSKEWHHYLIQWNTRGIGESRDFARVSVDGRQILALGLKDDAESMNKFRKAMSQPSMLFLAREFHEAGQNHSDYAIDELKIWSVDSPEKDGAAALATKPALKFHDGPALASSKRLLKAAAKESHWHVGARLSNEELPKGAADTKIEVSGLPPGVKFDIKSRRFLGIPAKGGLYNVALRITQGGKTTEVKKRVLVSDMPKWAHGAFAGGGEKGMVLFAIAEDGLLVGRWTTVDKTWDMQADSFAQYDEEAGICKIEVGFLHGKERFRRTVTISPQGVAGDDFKAWRCEWGSNPEWTAVANGLTGKTCRVEAGDAVLRFDIQDNAEVDVTYSESGLTRCSRALLIPVPGERLEYRIYVCIPGDRSGFAGYCGDFVFDGEDIGD